MNFTLSDCITIASVVLSGIISLVISRYYFNKGNRENFKSLVLTPINHIVDKPISKDGYKQLYEVGSRHEASYAKKEEQKIIWDLIDAYYQYLNVSEDDVRTDSVMEYFENKLRLIGIEPRCLSAYDEATHTEVDNIYYPDDYLLTSCDIKRIIQGIDLYDANGMSTAKSELSGLLRYKADTVYGKKDMNFFDDRSLQEVFTKSESHAKFIEKENKYHETKKKFNSIE